jgi:hypothetical protein
MGYMENLKIKHGFKDTSPIFLNKYKGFPLTYC